MDGVKHYSPYTNRKYRANVRVIDFAPHRLEDFAVGRSSSEYDILPDYDGGEETDSDDERRHRSKRQCVSKDIGEWRFELLVEDASPAGGKEQIWLTVDNTAAQGLLALEEDATW